VVLRTKQVEHIMSEKRLLTDIAFPFIINLYGAFQDEKYLYLTLEYSIGGEFFTHLRRAGKFSNDTARFYASQVLRALLTSCAARTLVANTNVARMLRLQK
jgi:serine/threonine protein kinase